MISYGYFGRQSQRARTGFTLIELLVVIGIIAVLLSILMPSLMQAKSLARRAACATNLHSIGIAAGMYQSEYREYIPICWANMSTEMDPSVVNDYKSWRTNLLPYTPFGTFNCPAAKDPGPAPGTGAIEILHSDGEVKTTSFDPYACSANVGTYGVISQNCLPSFTATDAYGGTSVGNPSLTLAFPTMPGVAWRDPAKSVYVADAYVSKGPLAYPSPAGYKGNGTSIIYPPSNAKYFSTTAVSRRFADRHIGTNTLFVGGHVLNYRTQDLEAMTAGTPGCVWDPS